MPPARPCNTRRAEATSQAADSAPAAPTRSQQQADALVLLAEAALHQELDSGAPGERYQVVVHVDAAVLEDPGHEGQTALEGGIRISAEPPMWPLPLPSEVKLTTIGPRGAEVADVSGAPRARRGT